MVTNFRETVSGITHLIAAILAGIGLLWLITITRDNPVQLIVMLVYGISLIAVFSASARMHLSHGTPDYMLRLRRHDHAAIYLVIAGTYTPLIVLLIDGMWQWVILVAIWGMCLFGVYWKLSQLQGRQSTLKSTLMYLLVGWFAVICAPLWVGQLDGATLALIAAGGLTYSVGAVVFIIERPNLGRHFGFHELWHIIVMIASLLHFLAIARLVMG